MSSTRGLVASDVPFSVVDGPGSRFVLFLQGCNFDCAGCHNPSTISRRLLTHPTHASPIAQHRTVTEIIGQLHEVDRFLSGITVTGGEPTLQIDFLVELFGAIKTDPELSRLTTLVDTNGTLPIADWRRLAPVLDGAMVDLKAFSTDLHRKLTGQDNEAVKESIRWLSKHDKLAEVRLLVIEGVTDDPEELAEWAGFVGEVDPAVPVRLMGFRHLGTRQAARKWPETTSETLERAAEELRRCGLTAVTAEVTSK